MKLLLVDLSAVFWRNWHATKDQEIGEAFARSVDKVAEYRDNYEYCVICCDVKPYKRKAISADYKSQRDAQDPAAVGQLRRVIERLSADGIPICSSPGYEADDIIATICARLPDATIDILTADKDLMALVNDRVTVIHLASGDRFGPAEVLTKMGVHPESVSELLALTGDTSDNVPGCPGIGPKKAAQLLADNGGIDAIVSGDPDDLVATGATRKVVLDNIDLIRQSLALVTLMTDAPIDVDALFTPVVVRPLVEINDKEFEVEDQVNVTEPMMEPIKNAPVESQTRAIEVATTDTLSVRAPAASFETSLEPTTTGQAWALSKAIHSSRLFAVESPEQALMILMTGREMGIGSMASLRGFHFVKGRPVMSAQLMAALILRSGLAEYWELVESSPKSATYATKRVGGRNEQRKTFTIDDAKLALLVKAEGNWQKYPTSMCEARAAAALARIVYPDLLAGVYLPEELEAT